jgi:ketosteroid isomerase-like protein
MKSMLVVTLSSLVCVSAMLVAPTAIAAGSGSQEHSRTVGSGLLGRSACNNPRRARRTVLDLYDAFAAGDTETIEAIIDEDVVWIESDGIPYGGTFIGRDAVFEGVFAKIAAEWEGFTAEVNEIFSAAGRRVVTLGQDSGLYITTGLSMVAPTASIWTLSRDCRVVRFQQYIDTLQVRSAIDIDL